MRRKVSHFRQAKLATYSVTLSRTPLSHFHGHPVTLSRTPWGRAILLLCMPLFTFSSSHISNKKGPEHVISRYC